MVLPRTEQQIHTIVALFQVEHSFIVSFASPKPFLLFYVLTKQISIAGSTIGMLQIAVVLAFVAVALG